MLEFESSPESPYAQSPKHLIFTAAREATYHPSKDKKTPAPAETALSASPPALATQLATLVISRSK
jgi:hypothetical protein